MRTAKPSELKERAFPVMTAKLSVAELARWFPVSFQEIDDIWAAPEPSKGALVELNAGQFVVLDYGKDSRQLTVRIPATLDASACLVSLFGEVPLPRSRILWQRADVRLPTPVATSETQLAEEIVGALGVDAVRVCTDDRSSIRFAIHSARVKLRSVILRRGALRRLLSDPAGQVKIEYLLRELRRAASKEVEFVFPRKIAKTVVEHSATQDKSLRPSTSRSRPAKKN